MNVATAVEVGGAAVPFHLRRVHWVQELFGYDRFALTFSYADLSDASAVVKDVTEDLSGGLGKTLTLRLAHFDALAGSEKEATLQGIVTGVRSRYGRRGMEVILEGAGAAHVLDRVVHTRSYQEWTWDRIVRDLVQPAQGLISNLDVRLDLWGGIKVPFCCEYQETDFAFLRRLCAAWGWIICAAGNELFIHAAENFRGFPGCEETTVIIPGTNCRSVGGGVRTTPSSYECGAYQHYGDRGLQDGNYGDSQVKAWTANQKATGQGFVSTGLDAGARLYKLPGSSHDGGVHWSQREADLQSARWARFLAGEGSFFEGASWISSLRPGGQAKVEKAVDLAVDWVKSETILITRVEHRIETDDYINQFEGCSAGSPRLLDPAAFPQRTRFVSIPGKVTRSDDPARVARVRVQPLILSPKWLPETIPARVAHRAAGPDHGELLQPEVGDEVLLLLHPDAFEEPIVTSVLYNGSNKTLPAKLPAHANLQQAQIDTNDLKWHLTRGGNAVIFDDTSGTERILVVTKTGSLELSEDSGGPHMLLTVRDGQNPKCTLTFDKQGQVTLTAKNVLFNIEENIVFKAGKDFSLDAQGKISLKSGQDTKIEAGTKVETKSGTDTRIAAGTKLETKSGMDTKIEAGMNASVKGTMQLKLEGGAQSELKGGAMVTIQGAIVKIN